jgi:hypothetical protein
MNKTRPFTNPQKILLINAAHDCSRKFKSLMGHLELVIIESACIAKWNNCFESSTVQIGGDMDCNLSDNFRSSALMHTFAVITP